MFWKNGSPGEVRQRFSSAFACGEPLYTLTYVVLIMFFAHFYLSIIYNPDEVADNIRKQGWIHTRNTAGPPDCGPPGRRSNQNHLGGRSVPLAIIALIPEVMLAGLRLNHLPVVGGRVVRRASADLVAARSERELLLRWHFAADCCGRGDGYRPTGRGSAHYAALRRVPEERPSARASRLVTGISGKAVEGTGADLLRPAGRRQGNTGPGGRG